MTVIAPCITAESPEAYQAAVERLTPFAQRVHIDLSDGQFAPNFLVGVESLYWPASWIVDIHIMSHQPSQYLQSVYSLRPRTVIFHAESNEDVLPLMQQVKQAGMRAGLALLKPTVPKLVAPLIEAADHVMIFSGTLGQYGGTASMMQLEKIRLVRMINQGVEIGWDGGAAVDNVFSLMQGGVDIINVGGAINRADDPQGVYNQMSIELSKQGVL